MKKITKYLFIDSKACKRGGEESRLLSNLSIYDIVENKQQKLSITKVVCFNWLKSINMDTNVFSKLLLCVNFVFA